MLRQMLNQQFGIKVEEEFSIERYSAYKTEKELYLIIPVSTPDDEEIAELEQIANHLVQYGDKHVSQFMKTKDNKHLVDWKEQKYCVIKNTRTDKPSINRIGRKLAKFHFRGRAISVPVSKINRIGQWKQLWEKRLEQMEKVWNDMLLQEPDNEFDRMFLESFPYYMGIAENSIQYLVDTELDEDPIVVDSGTVCHDKFSSRSWGSDYYIKNPFDWVFDHCSRDMAEWTREKYFQNIQTFEPDVKQFFTDYQSVTPLSSFSWRLLYARLMFPLHYFECIEGYYMTSSEQQKHMLQDKLYKYLEQTVEHERFLGDFYQLAEVPIRKFKIPKPEWLTR